MGTDFIHPIIGRSIFNHAKNDFALMHFYSLYGFMRGGKLAVLEPKTTPRTFRIAEDDLIPIQHDHELEKDALALLSTSSYLYQEQRHTLPKVIVSNLKRNFFARFQPGPCVIAAGR